MEGNISSGNVFDLQGSMMVNHHQSHHCHGRQELGCPSTAVHNNGSENTENVGDPSNEEEHSCSDEGNNNKACWQRVKWVDSMIRLLITAVSYLGEDALLASGVFGRRTISSLHKKGKWRLVSKAMGERGYCVSPQQCEDKFNDLNKRYKKLNDILGRGTSCQVVEKPDLLDTMNHLSEKSKDEVRKILSSKHLYYEEMCSYHNNNRLHLPHDPALQRFLLSALKGKDSYDVEFNRHDHDEDDHDIETDDHEEYVSENCSKRLKLGQGLGEFSFRNPHSIKDFNEGLQMQSEDPQTDKWSNSRAFQLQELRLKIEMETLELEKQRFKWLRFSKKKDRELEKLKMENEKMKVENERIALELKHMEMTMNLKKLL